MERMAHVTLCLGQVLQEDIAKEFFFLLFWMSCHLRKKTGIMNFCESLLLQLFSPWLSRGSGLRETNLV